MIEYIKNHKIISGVVAFLLVIIVATVVSLLIQNNSQPNSPEVTSPPNSAYNGNDDTLLSPDLLITNWTDIVDNVPNSEKARVETTLHDTITRNLPTTQTIPASAKPEIRTGTYRQTYNADTQIYLTEFLVDISDIQQTYRVVNQYSDLPPKESGLIDYATMVFCPTESDLVWPAFDCIDRNKIELGE
jgi:hypothetical protein